MFGIGGNKKNKPSKTTLSDSKKNGFSEIILAAIEDGVILIDAAGVIRSFNAASERITGWTANDSTGLNYSSVLKLVDAQGDEYSPEQNPVNRALSEGKVTRDNKATLLTIANKQLPILLSISPLVNDQREVEGVVAVFRDVSQERLEESRQAEFISTASHEMRTPVAAIEGYLSLAMNQAVCKIDSKAREYLDKAHTSTQHLGKLFQDLLTAARSEDGRLTNNPEVVEMGAFIHEVADANRFVAEKKGLVVELLFGSQSGKSDGSPVLVAGKNIMPLYYCHVDPDRMREVITNLFDNAVKYTDQGKITLSLTGDEGIVQISIADTGHGIPQEDIPHLFQKFYRVDNSATRAVGGTGLGLYICKKIIELYNGRIWAESQLDRGSTFYINLPRLSLSYAQKLQATQAAKQQVTLGSTPTAPRPT